MIGRRDSSIPTSRRLLAKYKQACLRRSRRRRHRLRIAILGTCDGRLTLRCTRSATAGFARLRTRVNSNVGPHGGIVSATSKPSSYRAAIDALVTMCNSGQGQIGASRFMAGVWNQNASPDSCLSNTRSMKSLLVLCRRIARLWRSCLRKRSNWASLRRSRSLSSSVSHRLKTATKAARTTTSSVASVAGNGQSARHTQSGDDRAARAGGGAGRRGGDGGVAMLHTGPRHSDRIERAAHATPAAIEHVGVDHRGFHIGMAEQLLHGADVVARLQQVGGERMAQHVR